MKNLGKNKAYKKNYLVTDNLSVFSLLACNGNVSVAKLDLVKKKEKPLKTLLVYIIDR